VVLEPVVAEGALVGGARPLTEADHPVGAGRDAVPAAVAGLLLDEDCVELGADDRVCWADLQAGRVLAVLADVRHHEPGLTVADCGGSRQRAGLDELDMSPVFGVQLAGVVEAVGEELRRVALELVPLLARHLAGLAADAYARVGEEALGLSHQLHPTLRVGPALPGRLSCVRCRPDVAPGEGGPWFPLLMLVSVKKPLA